MGWIRWGAIVSAIFSGLAVFVSADPMSPSTTYKMALNFRDVFGGLAIIFGVMILGHWLLVRIRKRGA